MQNRELIVNKPLLIAENKEIGKPGQKATIFK
jgi:hypothetical protein